MADDDTASRVIAFSGNTMVYESVKRFSIKALNELMRGLMENVDDALFDFAKKAETDNERNLYFEAALLIAMIGFVGTVALSKFITRGDIIE